MEESCCLLAMHAPMTDHFPSTRSVPRADKAKGGSNLPVLDKGQGKSSPLEHNLGDQPVSEIGCCCCCGCNPKEAIRGTHEALIMTGKGTGRLLVYKTAVGLQG